jgi:putative DNA primase/helicase
MAEPKRDYRQELTDRIIKKLEDGTAPWLKPWEPGELPPSPFNPTSNAVYRGINSLNLAMTAEERNYNDPRWMTYNQAADKGYQVRKGEKGTLIEYWKFSEEKKVFDEKGKPVIDEETGKQKTMQVKLETPRVFRSVVFNAKQIDNIPEWKQEPKTFDWNPSERAEQIIRESGARIFHDQADRAFYSPMKDEIHLPGRDQFKTEAAYYGTALHELGHWTGHESRLNREVANAFGSERYAIEELRAELASYFMSDRLGIAYDPGQHAAYVGSWIKVLKEDKNEIFRASRDAERITEFLMSPELEKNVEKAQERALSAAAVSNEQSTAMPEPLQANIMPAPGDAGYRAMVRDNEVQLEEDRIWLTQEAQIKIGRDVFVKTPDQNDQSIIEGRVITETKLMFLVQNGEYDAVILNKADFRQLPAVKQDVVIGPMDMDNPANGRSIKLAQPEPALQAQTVQAEKTFLDVPFKEKGEAKELGAKWDGAEKKWFVPAGVDVEPFKKWMSQEQTQTKTAVVDKDQAPAEKVERTILAVPFKEKGAAKEAGAKWDIANKVWYAEPGADLGKLAQWLPKQKEVDADPVQAFLDTARAAGLVIEGQPVIGKLTRVEVVDIGGGQGQGKGPKKGNLDGAYTFHLDGRPSGYIQNFYAGIKENWKHDGQPLSPEETKRLAETAAEVLAQRAVELKAQHDKLAGWVEKKLEKIPMTPGDGQENSYLMRKQVKAFGVHSDGENLVIPLRDIHGKLWSMQTIPPEEGEKKHLTKNARKEGTMHVIGAIESGKDILVTEGYATAASLHMATGKTVVMAVDSGNLDAVVGQLKERYPTSPIHIMGDDDRFNRENTGASKALEAAEKHQVGWALPKFSKEGKLTDFNDLHASEGLDAVKRQVEESINRTLMDSKLVAKAAVETKLNNGGVTEIVEKSVGDNTRHTGPFASVGSYHATQLVAKNEYVVHEIAKMDKRPGVDQEATVQYKNGRGTIKDKNQERQRLASREQGMAAA